MQRLYSLYERKRGSRKWTRKFELAFPKEVAIRVFQNMLLAPYPYANDDPKLAIIERSLRPIKRGG